MLKADPSKTTIELDIDKNHLKRITDYCAEFDYMKVRSTIGFPAVNNELSQNVPISEYRAIMQIQNNFEELKKLLVYSKKLRIDALYELTCCAIACFFKSRYYTNLANQVGLNMNSQASDAQQEA